VNEPEGFAHSMATFNCTVAGVYTTPAVQADYSVSEVTQQEIREENQLTTPSFFPCGPAYVRPSVTSGCSINRVKPIVTSGVPRISF